MKFITSLLIFTIISFTFSQVVTRGGKYTASYSSTDPFRANRTILRTKTIRVNFSSSYPAIPQVGVALYSFNLNYGDAGVRVQVASIQRTYFTYNIIAPAGAVVNAVGVQWIASNSASVNIKNYVANTAANANNQVAFASLSGTVGAVALISGFQFQKNTDPKLDIAVASVSSTAVRLNISTNANNQPNYISALVIQFKTSFAKSLNPASSVNGVLYSGSGTRHQYVDTLVAKKNYFLVNGISAFNFVGELGYRLTQTPSLSNTTSNTRIRYDMETALTTKIHQTKGALFYI